MNSIFAFLSGTACGVSLILVWVVTVALAKPGKKP